MQGAVSHAWAAAVQTLQLVSARALYGGEKVEMVFQDPAAAAAAGSGPSGGLPPGRAGVWGTAHAANTVVRAAARLGVPEVPAKALAQQALCCLIGRCS